MLHIVAFIVVTFLFLAVSSGLTVMLCVSGDRILTALQIDRADAFQPAVASSRIRIVTRVRNTPVMAPLRAAA